MSEKRQSTLSEKITAAATVATALAAAKTAEEAAKSRQEMEAMNQAMQLSSAKQEYIQLRMAAEQAESNFHNTLLAALPLLKNEEEKVQFLTEKLLPKLKKENDVEILSPIKAISFLVKKENQLDEYLKNEAGRDLKDFLSAGKDLLERTNVWNRKSEMREKQMAEFRETQKELVKIEKPFGVIDFVKISLWALLIGFIMFLSLVAPDSSGVVHVLVLVGGITVFGTGIYLRQKRRKIKRHKIKAKADSLTPTDGSPFVKEKQELDEKSKLQSEQWEVFRPQIVSYLVEKNKHILTCDPHSELLSVVTAQLEDGVKDLQSFLPPSARLPASHYAQYFFDETDVQDFYEGQGKVGNHLETLVTPDYPKRTIRFGKRRESPAPSVEES